MKYVATPYSHISPAIMQRRYELAVQAVLSLVKMYPGQMIYSPIVYWHPVALAHKLPTDHIYWQAINDTELLVCDEVFVIQFKDWEHSRGIARELETARSRELVITHLRPEDLAVPFE
jgi:hypothetical protein